MRPRRWFGRVTALAVPLAVAVGACDRHAAPAPTGDSPPAAAPRAALRKVPLQVPGEDTIPGGARGELVRLGRLLATRTAEELPALVGAELHCTSCHMEAGTRANAGPWVGIASSYPMYRARAGREITLEDRIDECFERSMNGRPPPRSSPEMNAFVAYIEWLSRDVPRGAEVVGRGFPRLERPPIIDPESGRSSYLARCASCHGADGQGRHDDEGRYQFPALWGEHSFNIGAGMARLDTAAAFVRENMPLGRQEPLTAVESYEIAAFFIEQPRADFARRSADWPRGGKPPDARY